MNNIDLTIAAGIGDNLIIRIFFDAVKEKYNEIRISHNKKVIEFWRDNNPTYKTFLDKLGNTLFTEAPYVFDYEDHTIWDLSSVLPTMEILPSVSNLSNILCAGNSLNLNEEYIVITTKIRGISKPLFFGVAAPFWKILKNLSQKYKIVILGEREIENSKENIYNRSTIFNIYDQIIANISSDRLIDLSVPALGITTPEWAKFQQDFLIMKEAKFVIAFGFGGNFWMALSVANVISYRDGIEPISDAIENAGFKTAFLTKNWLKFTQKLESYL